MEYTIVHHEIFRRQESFFYFILFFFSATRRNLQAILSMKLNWSYELVCSDEQAIPEIVIESAFESLNPVFLKRG